MFGVESTSFESVRRIVEKLWSFLKRDVFYFGVRIFPPQTDLVIEMVLLKKRVPRFYMVSATQIIRELKGKSVTIFLMILGIYGDILVVLFWMCFVFFSWPS